MRGVGFQRGQTYGLRMRRLNRSISDLGISETLIRLGYLRRRLAASFRFTSSETLGGNLKKVRNSYPKINHNSDDG